MNIGNKIISLRKERKMSQSKLAEILDVSRQTVSKWECNICVPEIERVKQLASIFNVSTDYLLDNNTNYPINKISMKIVNISKKMILAITSGTISLLLIVCTLIYCYVINPYTYKNENGVWHKGIFAHILGYSEVGSTGIILMCITLVVFILFIIFLLLSLKDNFRKKNNNF